jgi:uncharacterized protein YuzE
MQLSYDMNARALYISLSNEAVARTAEVDDNTNVDVDQAGRVVGIEVISIDHAWPVERILASKKYEISPDERQQLVSYFMATSASVSTPPADPTIGIAPPAPAAMLAAVA